MPLAVDVQGGITRPIRADTGLRRRDGAVAYSDTGIQEFATERTSRPRRDR
jgi:hypothetical protein